MAEFMLDLAPLLNALRHCNMLEVLYVERFNFMVGERVRFLFTGCGESQTNERVFERVNKNPISELTMM